MGIFTKSANEILNNWIENGMLSIKFSENKNLGISINESANIIIYENKKPITIYIRSKIEATEEHWCSIKVYTGGGNSAKSSNYVTYLVPGINEPIRSIYDINIDPKCKNNKFTKEMESNYGRIIRLFIMTYHRDIIQYWEAITNDERKIIEERIYDDLVKNKSKVIIRSSK